MKDILKKYPRTVTLRKKLTLVVAVILVAIALFIFTNLYRAGHRPPANSQQNDIKEVTQNPSATANWYKDKVVRKSNVTTVKQPITASQVIANTQQLTQINPSSQQTGLEQKTTEEMKRILSAPISSNQINDTTISASNSSVKVLSSTANQDDKNTTQDTNDQNMQSEKKAFLKVNGKADDDYLHEGLKNPVSPYELKAGAIIPAILITGINSDLPGQITAQVRSNVYDTVAGKYVLIPQGSKLTGLYDSQVAYGQSRVLIVWKRIIYPNGQSINLEGMPGVDMSGYAGFHDKVNNHYMKIFGSVLLMSVISAGAQLSQPDNNDNDNNNPTVNQTLAASLGANIMNSTNMILQKNLGVQPTLEIRPGYLMNISVTKDIVFPEAYQEATSYSNN